MGKKKGKDKNKLARMSEDERLRYIQHRAELEEEAKRRKQQLISTFMKNKLKKEEAFMRLNASKIQSEWRDILRKIKTKSMQDDLKAIKKECDEAIQRKNSVIRRLLADLDESEELYSTLLHSHMNIIEKLIDISDERLNFLRQSYEAGKAKILQTYERDMDDYKTKKFRMQKELESVYYGLAERSLKMTKTAEEEFLQKSDELRNSMTLKLEATTKEREIHMENLWKSFQQVLHSFLLYTEEFRDEYIDLRNRDAEETRSIQDHYNEVSKLSEKIADLKSQLINVKDEQDFNINQLIKHRNDLKEKMDNIKEDMEFGLERDKEKLKSLALMSHQNYKRLVKFSKMGENIIQLIKFCEHLELSHKLAENNDSNRNYANLATVAESLVDSAQVQRNQLTHPIYQKLDGFWIRLNRARIDCLCLKEHKSTLVRENRDLRVKLKKYLITVNMTNGIALEKNVGANSTLFRPSSLKIKKIECFEISRQPPATANPQQSRTTKFLVRPVTCIEGRLSNAMKKMSINNHS